MPEESSQQQGQQQQSAQEGQGQGGETPQNWEQWLGSQDDVIKSLYNDHVGGLKNALNTEREQRKEFERQLRDAAGKLQEGSDARKELETMAGQLAAAQAQADFYADAVRPETGCSNPRLAYLAAQEIGAVDRRGRINWDELKKQFPELFQKQAPPGNAGSGTGGGTPETKGSMDDFIRRKAGRR
jgi:hypothetical protein